MSKRWVDFRELRAKLRFADVLQHYNISLKIKGDRATGFCPLPGHPRQGGEGSGKRRSPSFSASLDRGIFQCFGCGAKGNVLDFVLLLQGGDPDDSTALRKVALELQDRFLTSHGGNRDEHEAKTPSTAKQRKPPAKESEAQQKPGEISARPVIVNAPLDFELKALDPEHPYLKQRGLTAKTIAHFGLGYCSRGLMQGRIAIPLHDSQGRLIGYAGRLVDAAKIDDENPKYRFPGDREKDGITHAFHKSEFLYGGHRIAAPVKDLIVVEGFASVWHLWAHSYVDVVALMGSSCSHEQGQMIANLTTEDGRVWLLPDGDDAGDRCAESLLTEVGKHRFIRWVSLEDGEQPTDLSLEELNELLFRQHE